ncbi:hypothetical protein BS50DRAFT_576579 [Corynespora cassiicola Philippines]|uniref:Extracellular membrane protein CFEM domain-containing protein n=1 Tax=Corynespora cassiicola Philippines TaxID=1448308 RepID=A0A2T2NET6_CORCC|nr:hypothetical protein BS50DRAFT_576579 [Corynespora cassiicola Philippines]
MYSKTIFVAAFAAIASVASAATPPSCLLGAVNSYDKPADLKAICESKDATSKISKICGDAKADALEAFADICNGQGVKVSTDVSATASGVASATGAVKPSGTGAVKPSGTGSSNSTLTVSGSRNSTIASATPTPTGEGAGSGSDAAASGTGSPSESTGAAGKIEVGVAALLAGIMAFAL